MIPLADENTSRLKPYVVYILIALNVLVYLADILGAKAVQYWSMVPYSVVHDLRVAPLFSQTGQMVGYAKLPGVGPHPQWITIFTSMFMHGSLMHIGGNMLYLWIFGNNIEEALGHVKFLLFYIAAGVLAALAHMYSNIDSIIPTVGASGAIAGVLGAYLVLYPRNSVRTLLMLGWFWDIVEIPAVYVLGVWFLLQLTGTLGTGGLQGGGVAYWAHVGGFVSGAILIFAFGGRHDSRPRQQRLHRYDEDRPRFRD
ncbi:MAG: rhomboid family intramembrane serine protease [Armatimonadetes bacterium]|nr:rhomboid family intramembrane serine protease [Armatimonadota bacterium]